jgi:hypothetical protein
MAGVSGEKEPYGGDNSRPRMADRVISGLVRRRFLKCEAVEHNMDAMGMVKIGRDHGRASSDCASVMGRRSSWSDWPNSRSHKSNCC